MGTQVGNATPIEVDGAVVKAGADDKGNEAGSFVPSSWTDEGSGEF